MTRFTLVRHGETDWNRARRIQGSSDIPLNALGREQAQEAGLLLAGRTRFDVVVASPLSRAADTAGIIARHLHGGAVELVPGLRERHYGEAEGLTGAEVERRYGSAPVPGRETPEEVLLRVRTALLEIAERHPGGEVLAVTHGGVIGAMVRDATAHAWPEGGQAIPNASAHRFRAEGGRIELVEFAGRAWPVVGRGDMVADDAEQVVGPRRDG